MGGSQILIQKNPSNFTSLFFEENLIVKNDQIIPHKRSSIENSSFLRVSRQFKSSTVSSPYCEENVLALLRLKPSRAFLIASFCIKPEGKTRKLLSVFHEKFYCRKVKISYYNLSIRNSLIVVVTKFYERFLETFK